MEPIDRRMLLCAAGLAGVAAMSKLASGGPLMPPPGPVSPTGKTLSEVEPRIPVQSLPGSATALHVISEPGSYYLTGNILGARGKSGIEVNAGNVTLDLSGYALIGVAGSAHGIHQTPGHERLRVMNGSITDWGQDGVHAFFSSFSTVSAVGLARIAGRATNLNVGSVVADCSARQVGGRSISVESLGAIVRCVTDACGSPSLFGQNRVLIVDCLAQRSGEGAVVEGGGQFDRCRIVECGLGVGGGADSVVMDCSVLQAANGVSVGERSIVERNTIHSTGAGVLAFGGQSFISANRVRGTSTPYSIAPGNSHGPIVNVSGVGDISAVAGANHPWANFIY